MYSDGPRRTRPMVRGIMDTNRTLVHNPMGVPVVLVKSTLTTRLHPSRAAQEARDSPPTVEEAWLSGSAALEPSKII